MNKSELFRHFLPTIVGVLAIAALSPAPLVGRGHGSAVPNSIMRDNEETLKTQGQPASVGQIGTPFRKLSMLISAR